MSTEINLLDSRLYYQLSPGDLPRIAELIRQNFAVDKYGLISVGQHSLRKLTRKVAASLVEVRNFCQQMMLNGKTIVYFPGSFDLVHLGHGSYIEEGVRLFLEHEGLNRDDLFVVVLADSDNLIKAAKPKNLQKDGEHPRPIQTHGYFNCLNRHTDINPRLLDLASLDAVDMVALIPSPTEIGSLIGDRFFEYWISKSANFEKSARHLVGPAAGTTEGDETRAIIEFYKRIVSAIRDDNFESVLLSFGQVRQGLEIAPEERLWTLESWQLLIHHFLGSVWKSPNAGYYRILSARDQYSGIVERLMNMSGVHCARVNDTHVISTTRLLEIFGWQALCTAKAQSFRQLVAE